MHDRMLALYKVPSALPSGTVPLPLLLPGRLPCYAFQTPPGLDSQDARRHIHSAFCQRNRLPIAIGSDAWNPQAIFAEEM